MQITREKNHYELDLNVLNLDQLDLLNPNHLDLRMDSN